MSKILAIKGDEERGSEVIALLEMLGGDNKEHCQGIELGAYYYIDIRGCITYEDCFTEDELEIFTLDEFYKKYPFKVGDKVIYTKFGYNCDDYPVTIESMEWTGTTIEYTFYDCVTCLAKDLKMWKSNDNPTNVSEMKNVLAELIEHIKTTSKEELEREFDEIKGWSNIGPTVEEFKAFCECVNKKPVYPKTFKECRAILNYIVGDISGYKASLLANLQDLLVCRDAYWKIAGEQMGLNKPWKPEYISLEDNTYFTIQTFNGGIDKSATSHRNTILAFPTIEMRDAFYENFKDLIEQCKELL